MSHYSDIKSFSVAATVFRFSLKSTLCLFWPIMIVAFFVGLATPMVMLTVLQAQKKVVEFRKKLFELAPSHYRLERISTCTQG
jgi:hypothetical protein